MRHERQPDGFALTQDSVWRISGGVDVRPPQADVKLTHQHGNISASTLSDTDLRSAARLPVSMKRTPQWCGKSSAAAVDAARVGDQTGAADFSRLSSGRP